MLSNTAPDAPVAVVTGTDGVSGDAPVVTGSLVTPEHELAEAAQSGNLEALNAALAQGADPSSEVSQGDKRFSTDEWPTALEFAIQYGHAGVVQALLDAHARCEAPRLSRLDWLSGSDRAIVRESGRLGRPPLHFAVQTGRVEDARIIWTALVDAGASDEHLRILLGSGPNKWIVNNVWKSRGMASWLFEQAMRTGRHTLEVSRALVAFLFDAKDACHFKDSGFLGRALHTIASTHADVEFARFILERAGTEDARRLCRIASPIDSERTLLEKKIGFDHQKGKTRYEFDHYIEDDNWTALIAAAWYGRPAMMSLIIDELRKGRATQAEADQQVHALLQLGRRPGINIPAALFLAIHRASKFKELVEHASGQRPGPAPTEYMAGRGRYARPKAMRGENNHGYRDQRTDEEMLRDLEECVATLSETVRTVDPGCSCVLS